MSVRHHYTVSFRLSYDEFKKLEAEARDKDMSKSTIIRIALKEYFRKTDWLPEKAKKVFEADTEMAKINEVKKALVKNELYNEFRETMYQILGYAIIKGVDNIVKTIADMVNEVKEVLPEEVKSDAEKFIEEIKKLGYNPCDIFFGVGGGKKND